MGGLGIQNIKHVGENSCNFEPSLIYQIKVNQNENGIHENCLDKSINNAAERPAENQVNQHENGIHNAAEPPAGNQVNQHDGSRNIMVRSLID
ncbi:hypothetical protein Pint_19789 [Pistacia integerrima]|uniref:Uncharacterized protein n=1 Tax=Pistacia integerrima TaxID=434235 RepID=A0ACC0XCS4_9ROSI|nr:hypothetical protein Pint_19789 [Pistacia integerrima]